MRSQLKMHIGDALGEQCTRLLQGMLAVSAHKDMPSGFLLLPFLEPAAGTGTFAALKGRLRKVKDTLLSKAFKRWAVVFFCQHEGCHDPLGAHPASAFELREPTETLRKLAPYLQALSTLVKVGAAAGKLLHLPLPSRIPFVSDAVDAATGAAALSRSELGDLYDSVGAELGLEASAGEAATASVGAAEAAVAAAGQKEQEAAYQAVKAALDNKRVGKEGSGWRREHGLQLCTVVQQQLWCCKTCAAQLLAGSGGKGGSGSGRPDEHAFGGTAAATGQSAAEAGLERWLVGSAALLRPDAQVYAARMIAYGIDDAADLAGISAEKLASQMQVKQLHAEKILAAASRRQSVAGSNPYTKTNYASTKDAAAAGGGGAPAAAVPPAPAAPSPPSPSSSPAPLPPLPARVAALEEAALGGAQAGALLQRIKGLEEAMLGEASGGAMPARVAALEAALS
jgi:hypothetical protein